MTGFKDWIVRVYLFVLFLTLPLDWFEPTGKLLREFGAKPAAPLLVFGSACILIFQPSSVRRLGKLSYRTAWLLALIFLLGCGAFWLNLAFSWSGFGRTKNPVVQFAAQALLFLAFSLVVISHAALFKSERWRSFGLSVFPAVIVIQLAVFLLDAVGIVSHAQGWLSLFRNGAGLELDRPSGLMSEPSYFGVFAAMYGFPLLVIQPAPWKWMRRALALALFVAAILVRAKTFVPVLLLECAIFVWQKGRAAIRLKYVLGVSVLLIASAVMIVANATFDLRDNLSSVERLGSTDLALNVAAAGYGLTGIGFGQFHFFYRPQFAPNFLFASQEAQDQMMGSIDSRASTYNLYARFLVETGIVGLVAFLFMVAALLREFQHDYRQTTVFGLLLVAASLGFLFTQDTYFYPPLAVGMALLLGASCGPGARPQSASAVETSDAVTYAK